MFINYLKSNTKYKKIVIKCRKTNSHKYLQILLKPVQYFPTCVYVNFQSIRYCSIDKSVIITLAIKVSDCYAIDSGSIRNSFKTQNYLLNIYRIFQQSTTDLRGTRNVIETQEYLLHGYYIYGLKVILELNFFMLL